MQDARTGGIQAIARAGAVLRALEQRPEGVSLAELAQAVELPKSTVHRLVGALATEELTDVEAGGRVHLGPALARLAAATRPALVERLRALIEQLSVELEETVDLAVLDGAAMRFVDQVPGPQRLRAVSAIGAEFPLHCTANGKAMLAALEPRVALSLLSARLPRLTPNTITSRTRLAAELTQVGKTGVAYDREEHSEGICALGAVVFDQAGPAAALSIPVPTPRFEREQVRYAKALMKASRTGSVLLGAM
ncbi:MAG TPA: IclR family transcriptional regulator [Solirubrobacteraceae bacterium]